MEYTGHKQYVRLIFFGAVGVVVLLLIFFGLRARLFSPQAAKTVSVPPAPPFTLGPGRLLLKTKTGESLFSVGQPITLVVVANSAGQPIAGYDVVVKYDPNSASFVSSKSLLDDFQAFPDKTASAAAITAVRKLNVSNTPFTDTALAEFVFQPKSSGTLQFSLDFVPASTRDSNLIDETSKDILGGVQGITVRVQ